MNLGRGKMSVVCRIGGERLNVLEEMTWNGQNGGVFQYFRKNNTSNDLQIGWVMNRIVVQ